MITPSEKSKVSGHRRIVCSYISLKVMFNKGSFEEVLLQIWNIIYLYCFAHIDRCKIVKKKADAVHIYFFTFFDLHYLAHQWAFL